MTRDQAIRKVLRCLRLAASSNPHEAAAALRQARALMAQHGLSEGDVLASEFTEASAPTRARGAVLPASQVILANAIAAGFRCEFIQARQTGWRASTRLVFVGTAADAQVAAYAFTVLRRQLEADRAKYTRRIRKRANRAARGEQFALGWVGAVRQLFPAADLSAEHSRALAAAFAARFPDAAEVDGREIGKRSWKDEAAGYIRGSSARFNPGLAGDETARLTDARERA